MSTKGKILSLRVTGEIRAKLQFVAKEDDRSVSNLVERFIKNGLKEWEKNHSPIASYKPQL